MITTSDIQRLLQHDSGGRQILSLFLDMSVNSDNKRTHQIFLNKERARFAELESDRANHHREPLGAVLAQVDRWIAESFEPTNRGVAIFADVGGDWFEALQLPTPLPNRFELNDYPVIGPLTQAVGANPRCGVIIVDREHLRVLSLYMGTVVEESNLSPAAIDTPHDVQAGGYSHKDFQSRKAEETRQFFRDFADEVARVDQRLRPDYYMLHGTTENTQNFREYLPKPIADRIVHTAHMSLGISPAEVARTLQPVLDELSRRTEAEALNLVQDRVKQAHYAASGLHDTLVQLQEGTVARLVIARDLEREGVQCTQCGFYLVRRDGSCPYCGGSLRNGVDLVESMIRMAANQAVDVEFVPGDSMRDYNGVAALLKF